MMHPAVALMVAVTEGQFQAAWYYSIVVAAIFVATAVGAAWGLRGAAAVWRGGDHAAGLILGAAALTGFLIMAGFLLAGAFALHTDFSNG